jgi:hypothetical protein
MSAIPGTFRNRPPFPRRDLSPQGKFAEDLLLSMGALCAERYVMGECLLMLAREPLDGRYIWHLSISHPSRYPTWDEIKTARYGMPGLAEVSMAQILGPVGDGEWVNLHENCFHLYEIGAGDDPALVSPVAPDGTE